MKFIIVFEKGAILVGNMYLLKEYLNVILNIRDVKRNNFEGCQKTLQFVVIMSTSAGFEF